MNITPKFRFVEGSFDTETNKMLCIGSYNHGTVELCFKEEGCGWNIPFAEIKLYDSELYKDLENRASTCCCKHHRRGYCSL